MAKNKALGKIFGLSKPKKTAKFALFTLILVDSLLLAFFILGSVGRQGTVVSSSYYPEAKELSGKQMDFKELSNYFRVIAEEKGAEYAFEVLKIAPIPPNIDMHLLGHVVGDILYKQRGVEGIKICTHDFRNACSHSIVVGTLLEEGEGAFEKLNDICRQAPGGKGAYTMCLHGLGHGVLAFASYDMEKAVELCRRTGAIEFPHCVSGVTMEMIAGVHDRDAWEKQVQKYFKDDDPLYPCSADFIPPEAKPMCYVYLTPHLFEFAGADLGRPTAENFKKAFPYCGKIPKNDQASRDACYGGFGKEFVVLAQDRDIRKIDQINEEQMKEIYSWCLLVENKEGSAACLAHAMNSLYWGGENDRSAAIGFCGIMTEPYYQKSCYMGLINAVSFYIDDNNYRSDFCNELPDGYREDCQERLTLKN